MTSFPATSLITSTYFSDTPALFFALITMITIAVINIPRICSKSKTIVEAVFSLIAFLLNAFFVFYSLRNTTPLVFSMLNVSLLVIICFLKCRTYLGKYSFTEAVKSSYILPFICIVALYSVLYIVVVLVYVYGLLVARTM